MILQHLKGRNNRKKSTAHKNRAHGFPCALSLALNHFIVKMGFGAKPQGRSQGRQPPINSPLSLGERGFGG